MKRDYPNRKNLWPYDLKVSPEVGKNNLLYTGRNKCARKKQIRVCYPKANPSQERLFRGWGKETSLAKVWLTNIFFQTTSGDKQFSQSFMKQN